MPATSADRVDGGPGRRRYRDRVHRRRRGRAPRARVGRRAQHRASGPAPLARRGPAALAHDPHRASGAPLPGLFHRGASRSANPVARGRGMSRRLDGGSKGAGFAGAWAENARRATEGCPMSASLEPGLSRAVSPYAGIVGSLEECLHGTADPPLFQATCALPAGEGLLGAPLGHLFSVGGTGATRAEAAGAAVGEALERYSATYVPRATARRSPPRGSSATSPSRPSGSRSSPSGSTARRGSRSGASPPTRASPGSRANPFSAGSRRCCRRSSSFSGRSHSRARLRSPTPPAAASRAARAS